MARPFTPRDASISTKLDCVSVRRGLLPRRLMGRPSAAKRSTTARRGRMNPPTASQTRFRLRAILHVRDE